MPTMTDEAVRRIVAEHTPKTLRQRLYRMRHHELLTELYLCDPVDADRDLRVVDFRATLSRDKLICGILDWRVLFAIESVNCPACWARPKQPCIVMLLDPAKYRNGVTPTDDLPRMYHGERKERAVRKVGLP